MKIWIFIFLLFRQNYVYIYDGGSLFGTELASLYGISSFPNYNFTTYYVTSTGTELYIKFIGTMEKEWNNYSSETRARFKIQFDAG